MSTERKFDVLLRKAEKQIKKYDLIDGHHRHATPDMVGSVELLRTAMAALEASINRSDWDLAAEAYVYIKKDCIQSRRSEEKVS